MKPSFKILASFAFIAFVIGYCVTLLPDATEQETANQRAIADDEWKHHAGMSNYDRFVEHNQ